MKWIDEGIVLTIRPFSERKHLITILTPTHGRYAGLVRGGRVLQQPGNKVQATWSARLSEHLGSWSLEVESVPAALMMMAPQRLACLTQTCFLLEKYLPERHPYPLVYALFHSLVEQLASNQEDWQHSYVLFQVTLLKEIGFGLDLSACAVTGQGHDLAYISPKTGRAVSRNEGKPYHDKLFLLPAFLTDETQKPTEEDLQQALVICQHFLKKV